MPHLKLMSFASLVTIPISLLAQASDQADRYPLIRSLLQEAETAAIGIRYFDDRSNPRSWASTLYARAGYLSDAIRANDGRADAYHVWKARVLYGELEAVDKTFDSISDPEDKASRLISLADFLWRMGEPDKARVRFEAAKPPASRVANQSHRNRLLASIEQGLTYVANDPPELLTPQPKPQPLRPVRESPLPAFPITSDGFRQRGAKDIETAATANAEFLTNLYGRVVARDREGLAKLVEAAATPFQKVLGLASVEHLLILVRQPEEAERYAKLMPTPDSDCSLAKAEALSAVGAAWLEANNPERAQQNFEAAISLVNSVRDLPLGKVMVLLSIARAQSKGGMVATSGATLQLAKELAQGLPLRQATSGSGSARPVAGVHFRDEAYERMLQVAVEMRNLGAAQEIANLWRQADSKADPDIIRAWFDADRVDDAINYARAIPEASQRAKTILVLAQALLDRAGAPKF
jgi:tetratricopeptide (TPR) repeat protein